MTKFMKHAAAAIALTGLVLLPFAADARGGGRGGGGGGGAARAGGGGFSGAGGAGASRQVRSGASSNINHNVSGNQNINANRNISGNANVNRNVNANQNINANVNRNTNVNIDNGGGWGNDWDHPVAAGMAVGATAAITAAAIGSIAYSVPPGCGSTYVGDVSYYQCGSTWYQPQYAGTSVQYVVVNPPQ